MANRKNYLPQKVNRYPSKNKPNNYFPKTPFSPNMMNGNNLHTKGKDVTGYIRREVYIKDKEGNIKVARETQLINSWKKIGYFHTD